MSDIFRTFIAENQSLEFSYAEALIMKKTLFIMLGAMLLILACPTCFCPNVG